MTGGGEVRLLQANEQMSIRGISPDGKTLLADSAVGHLVKIMLSPRVQATTLTQGNSHELAGTFSSDGKWIAYMSDQNGRIEVFVTSAADATQKWQVSNSGGTYPRWRGDGKELFYLDLTNRMTAVPIDANGDDLTIGTPHTLFSFTPRPQCRPYDVSADGQRFLINAIAEQESPNAVLVSNWKARIKP